MSKSRGSNSGSKEFPESFLAGFLIAVVLLRFLAIPDGPRVSFVEIVTGADGNRSVIPFNPGGKKE